MAPQPPLPPEIEGNLKKLKRKTSNLTGSWNKRWFFVDPKRLEFGYAQSKAPNAPKSSIYLNDITAVLQFDDTHFQVESRTRNFFLCGESKASTACWVKSLDEYRKKLIEYEKQLATLAASVASPSSEVDSHSTSDASSASNQARASDFAKRSLAKKTKKSVDPARDSSHQDSSLSVSASSSSNLADDKTSRNGAMKETGLAALEEHRLPSPIEPPGRSERRESKLKTPLAGSGDRARDRGRDSAERESRGRARDKHEDHDDGDRERERRGRERGAKERDARNRDRDRDRDADDERGSQRDRSTSAQRRAGSGKGAASGSGSSSRTSSGRGVGARPNGTSASSTTGFASSQHPHGYVMHAWMDEYD